MYMGSLSPYGASLISYSVDKEGYLVLPVIGKILVKDKTIQEVSLLLKDSLNHILNQPIVSVKLVNRYISVLGEVRSPGHFAYSQEKITIYAVSYTHLRAHETDSYLVCRLLLEKKK